MTCTISPPTETVYTLLAAVGGAVIVTADGYPILLDTYETTVGQVDAPGSNGQVDAPGSNGQVDAPGSSGQVDAPGVMGQIDAPRETC